MTDIFGFLSDVGNYEDRLVENTKLPNLAVVDTVRVSDAEKDYETAVSHPDYNEGDWIVVEAYDTAQQAKEGHAKWVNVMEEPPDMLEDKGLAGVRRLFGDRELKYTKKG